MLNELFIDATDGAKVITQSKINDLTAFSKGRVERRLL